MKLLAVLLSILSISSFSASASEDRISHYASNKFNSSREAIASLSKNIKTIARIIENKKLHSQDLEDIHEISYSLEAAVDKIRADNGKKNEDKVDNLDEAVQAIHSSSENHKEAETRKWFAVLEKTAMIVSKSF